MSKKILSFIFLLTISIAAFAQANNEYGSTLKQMFEVSGADATYKAVTNQLFGIYKQQYPDIEAAAWEDIEAEFAQTSLNDLTEMLVPVYSKYLTIEDLKELIHFYQTPVGSKLAKSTPFITKESMQIGQEWGMKIGQEFAEKMKEKGYTK